jgi:hypothetical protein
LEDPGKNLVVIMTARSVRTPCDACDVRLWHIADVPLAPTNVCFEEKNRHDACTTHFRL